jgi:hypothetical protein
MQESDVRQRKDGQQEAGKRKELIARWGVTCLERKNHIVVHIARKDAALGEFVRRGAFEHMNFIVLFGSRNPLVVGRGNVANLAMGGMEATNGDGTLGTGGKTVRQ